MASLVSSSRLDSAADTYLYTIARALDKYAVIDSSNTLRIFDATRLHLDNTIVGCNDGVECLIGSQDEGTLFTAGRDAFARCWDARTLAKTLEVKEPKGAGISALSRTGSYLAVGTESTKDGLGDVSVHIFDLRKLSMPLRTYAESHTDTITDIAWHPMQKNILLTGSTDGLVSLFDVEQADEEDAIQQVLNPRSAIHCAGFLKDDQAYVLSTDEQFSIYGLNRTGTAEDEALPVAEFGDLRPKLDCMYVIKLLQSIDTASPILAHGHNENKTLALTVLDGVQYTLGRTVQLPDAHGDDVVRDVLSINQHTLLSCGEDGFVKAWRLGDSSAMDLDEAPKSAKKRLKDEKKQSKRFQPY